MNHADIFADHYEQIEIETKSFLSELRNRVASIEQSLPHDFELPEYERGLNQIKFLNKVIRIITLQQDSATQAIECLAFDLEKLLELEQIKLELNRLKRNNSFLIDLVPRLTIRKVRYQSEGFATRESYQQQEIYNKE